MFVVLDSMMVPFEVDITNWLSQTNGENFENALTIHRSILRLREEDNNFWKSARYSFKTTFTLSSKLEVGSLTEIPYRTKNSTITNNKKGLTQYSIDLNRKIQV